jgi:signal transduction histidine kinase
MNSSTAEPVPPRRWWTSALARLGGTGRVWLLVALLAGAAAAVYFTRVRYLDPLPLPDAHREPFFPLEWWVLAAMFFVAEVFVIHIQFRRDAHSFSLNELPIVLGLFFAIPSDVVIGQLVGAALALIVHRRQSPLKVSFNLAHFTLGAGLAVIIFHQLAQDPMSWQTWLAAFLATFVASQVSALSIAAAISVAERAPVGHILQATMLVVITTLTNTSLALAVATVIWLRPLAGVLLLVPIVVLFIAYRTYSLQREKHESLEFLYESTRILNRTLQVAPATKSLLIQVRKMFRAEMATLTLFSANPDEPAVRTTLGPGDHYIYMAPVHLDPTEGVWARVASEREALLLARPILNERIRRYFEVRRIRDAMVAPLYGETGVVGIMMVANRLGNVSTFDDEDLKLFETLANHASVSLENARLVSRLKESLAHLREMDRLKDDFVANVSHELRTPLTSIVGYVKTLLRPNLDIDANERRTFLQTVERQSDRLSRLIEDLLVVSRLETNEVRPATSTISLPTLARQVLEENATRSDHLLSLDFEEHLPLVQSDEGKVHQILSNLMDNAIKYSPEQSQVTLKGERQGAGILLTVTDEGPGIPAELHDRIFERFYRVEQSTTRIVGGTGLGLYICKRLADVVGARLWLDRSSPDGSVFCLWLPVTTAANEVTEEATRGGELPPPDRRRVRP